MATISETSDDGSNGGDPNMKPEESHKNPQEEEEENQNENPKDVDQEDYQEEEKVENHPPIPREIPLELIEKTIAPIRRCHYPLLSLLSNAFRQVISSEDLFQTRSRIGLTEPVLYTLITFKNPTFEEPRWFILHRSNVSLQLTRVTSLPPMFRGCTTVTIGHKMYVMGGCRSSSNRPVKTVFVIDCRFHTWRYLPNMERARCYAASGVIDGQIYVVGGCTKRHDDWIEVFDVTTATWETAPGLVSSLARSRAKFDVHVVLDNMIYILDGEHCLGYNPRLRTWETWGFERLQWYFWHASCVVDDLLYAVVPNSVLGSPIVVYDPRKLVWRPVMGVDYLPKLVYSESRLANFGGKLVILGSYQSRDSFDKYGEVNVWCVEVALEKREDGNIWGKVQSLSLVNKFRKSPFLELSRTVTV
ncbi:Kelch repeat type 1 [Arabidopsis thaliana x Arabidopsis arenosa]|uniref:Kelch repeat type 1 n=1 Tax=Arabidopsis thaliana x Arabidopsis arenosa TaxID=1240361 RepID=A0A8T2A774_9BRAS|nr:Kelch repeat type 1 [Arabidopsis thaliana x Arabidopsis arenosa]